MTVSATVLVKKVVPVPELSCTVPPPMALPVTLTVREKVCPEVAGSLFASRAWKVTKLTVPTVGVAGFGV